MTKMFKVADGRQWQPQPAPQFPLSPDPSTPGVTWYQDYAGVTYPGYGTYYDVVAANIDSILLVADNIDEIEQILGADYLPRAGGTMLGSLLLHQNPVQNLEAVTLQYLQSYYVPLTGAALTGTLTLAGPPQNMNDAATKAYVDQYAGVGYSGTWQVAANNPDIRGGSTTPGQYYMAVTVDPRVPETAPAGVPGIAGQSIANGDRVIWDNVTKVWQKVAAGTDFGAYDQRYVQLSGSTMTGQLGLPNPTGPTNAVNVQYMTANALMLSGGTMVGPITLAGNATSALQPVSLQQMQSAVGSVPGGATISDTAPASPALGQLWFDSTRLQTYCWYNDGTSFQWTPVSSLTGGPYASPSYVDVGDSNTAAAAARNVGRNLLHNPLFNIQQRGAGTFTATGAQAIYSVDRWVLQTGVAGDTLSLLMNTPSDADRAGIGDETASQMASLTITGSATTTSLCRIQQKIENVRRLAGKTVTISFWAVGNVANRIGVSIDQYFGSGGSPSASIGGTGQSVAIASSWARYSFSIAIPSAAGKTLGTNGDSCSILNLWLSAGSGNSGASGGVPVQGAPWYCNLWGVQLEIGSVATPLEKPDPQQDLAKCQRFYQTGFFSMSSYAQAGYAYSLAISLPVSMRALPNCTSNFSSVGNLTATSITANTNGSLNVSGSVTATAGTYMQGTFTASADP